MALIFGTDIRSSQHKRNNMKLEDQVTNLELSKKLKELGIKQNSLFWWSREHQKALHKITFSYSKFETADKEPHISAFTVAELGEMLPKTIKSPKAGDKRNWQDVSHISTKEREEMRYVGILSINKPTDWIVLYQGYIILGFDIKAHTHDKTMANAMAKMLIYLIENKLINL